jgi:hypothetical protein
MAKRKSPPPKEGTVGALIASGAHCEIHVYDVTYKYLCNDSLTNAIVATAEGRFVAHFPDGRVMSVLCYQDARFERSRNALAEANQRREFEAAFVAGFIDKHWPPKKEGLVQLGEYLPSNWVIHLHRHEAKLAA